MRRFPGIVTGFALLFVMATVVTWLLAIRPGHAAALIQLEHRTTSQAIDPKTGVWHPLIRVAPPAATATSPTATRTLPKMLADTPATALPVPTDPMYSRQRAVAPGAVISSIVALTSPRHGQRLALNLFPDTSLVGVVSRHDIIEPGRGILYGYLENSNLGSFIVTYEGEMMAAAIWDANLTNPVRYEVRPTASGGHLVVQINESHVPLCGHESPDVIAQIPARSLLTPEDRATISESTRQHAVAMATAAAELGGGAGVGVFVTKPVSQSTLTRIDVMMLYTDDARSNNGGTSGIGVILDLALATANVAYANSGVNVELCSKHRAEVDYVETANLNSDLNRLSNGVSPFNTVASLRSMHGADLVCLFVQNGNFGGLAYLYNGTARSGFSVIKAPAPVDTFAHEVGHNQGCAHDRENAMVAGTYAYSYGWRATINGEGLIRSIMSYAPGFPIPFFSNPDIELNGVPFGVPAGQLLQSNNAKTVNQNAAAIAGSLGASANTPPQVAITSPAPNASLAPLQQITITASATDPGGSISRVDFFLLNNDLTATLISTDTTAPYSTSQVTLPPGEQRIAAVARDNAGASSVANVLVSVGAVYTVETIPPLTGFDAEMEPAAINRNGAVTGVATSAGGVERAFLYQGGATTNLGVLAGHANSAGKAINASGVIVGISVPVSGSSRGFRYTPGVGMVDLNTIITGLGGATVVDATGISDSGHILFKTSAGVWRIWNGNTSVALQVQPGGSPGNITAHGMSPNGNAVGWDYNFGLAGWRAIRWTTTGSATLLPNPAGLTDGFGFAVNNAGNVTGHFGNGSPTSAAIWISGTGTDLGTFGGNDGWGNGINSYDEVAGYAEITGGFSRGFIRRDGTMRQVADLVADAAPFVSTARWSFFECNAINDRGQVAGRGSVYIADVDGNPLTNDAGFFNRAFLLNPTAGVDVRYWNATQFTDAELLNVAVSGTGADPDGDGKSNLLERALNTDPRRNESERPAVAFANGSLTISFRRLKIRTGLIYTVQVSNDFVNWTTIPTVEINRVSIDENSERVILQIPAAGASESQFVRLVVQQQ